MTTSTLPSYRKTETFIIAKKGKDAEQIKSGILTYIYILLWRELRAYAHGKPAKSA